MTSIKKWFESPDRNKEILEDPAFFCEFHDKCTTKSARNCKRCLDHERRNEALVKVFKDGS